MVKIKLAELMAKFKIVKLSTVAKGADVPLLMVRKMYYEILKELPIKNMGKLCAYFYKLSNSNFKIDDLLEFIPDNPPDPSSAA